VPPVPADVVYGIGRIDASGRIADRAVTSALGWRGGDRLTLTADAAVVTARRDPGRHDHAARPRVQAGTRSQLTDVADRPEFPAY
jgi:hypothetical protein